MAHVALFHSVLGVTAGVHDAARRLRDGGHTVEVVDSYDGRTFDDYEPAMAWVESELGYEQLMARAMAGVEHLPAGIVCAGFSNGAGQAELVGGSRPGALGALLFSGALPPGMLGIDAWPASVPVQVHYGTDDPFRDEGVEGLEASVRASGADFELVEYPITGHLFTDESRPDEYDAASAGELWQRALAFLARVDGR